MDGCGNGGDIDSLDGLRMLRRTQAIAADDSSGKPLDLGTIWRGLAAGVWKVEDSFTSGERSYLVLREVPGESSARLSEYDVAMLGRVVLAGCVKVVAQECQRRESTVVLRTKRVLSFIGLRCVLSRAPAVIMQAAYAARGSHVEARVAPMACGPDRLLVASAPRPDTAVAAILSHGEREVLRGFFDGESYAEIARSRHRSVRTVANQLSGVFRKLRVSGRLQLIRQLTVLSARPSELWSGAA